MELDATLRKGFRLGDWEIRPIEGLVTGAEGSRHLQPKTMDVLVCLAAQPGQVVTRDELIARVWNNAAVSDEPLTRCIHEIRRCLGDHRGEPAYIKTIPKRGYQLLAPVGELDPVVRKYQPRESAAAATRGNLFWQVTRQRVLWAGVAYVVLAWVFTALLRLAERLALEGLVPPDWLLPVLVVIVLLGFPVAIFYAWVRQIRFDSSGHMQDSNAKPGAATLLWSRRGIDIVLVTLVISVLAGFALDILPAAAGFVDDPAAIRMASLPFGQGNPGDLQESLLTGCQQPIWAQ